MNSEGIIDLSELERSLKLNTVLVSIMAVNNEVGSIQPLKEANDIIRSFGKAIKYCQKKRIK